MAGFLEALWDIAGSESTYINAALFAAFLAFAASGEWVAERSGTLNISVEGMLLGGAFTSAVGYVITNSSSLALLAGALGGMVVAAIQAEMSHRLAAGQFVVGLTLNILVFGLVGFERDQPRNIVRSRWNPIALRYPCLKRAVRWLAVRAVRSSRSAGWFSNKWVSNSVHRAKIHGH